MESCDAGLGCTCSICLDDTPGDFTKLDCGHTFHSSCLVTWLWKKQECPLCRAQPVESSDSDESDDDGEVQQVSLQQYETQRSNKLRNLIRRKNHDNATRKKITRLQEWKERFKQARKQLTSIDENLADLTKENTAKLRRIKLRYLAASSNMKNDLKRRTTTLRTQRQQILRKVCTGRSMIRQLGDDLVRSDL